MRIGIVSDIHCDAEALRRALEEMQPVDRVLCAGDMVLQYRFSNEVMEIIQERGITAVRGNHDTEVLSSAGAALRASGSVHPDNLGFLESLPDMVEMDIEGKRIVMMHTSPLDPTGGGRDIRYGSASQNGTHLNGHKEELPESRADVLIVGHTHRSVVTMVGNTLVINPGSIGQSRDSEQPYLRTYAVLDTSTWEAVIGSFQLPPQEV